MNLFSSAESAKMPPYAPFLFLFVGAGLGFLGFRDLYRAHLSVDWPVANGTLVESQVIEVRRRQRGMRSYKASIRYDYAVDGQQFQGTRVAFGDSSWINRDYAQTTVNRYRSGSAVEVHFMPGSPSVSVLEPGVSPLTWAIPGISLASVAVGLCTLGVVRSGR
ncbi:MAG: DUF3592 domain-containing protein [Planctomycetales bacterium]|nr:DUF3592 domain-containing protein [Planctomycetales bacterium]